MPVKLTPMKQQKEAIKYSVEALKKDSRTVLKMACGTGKTFASMWISRKLNPKRILICAPTIALVDQLYCEWKKMRPWQNMSVMAVCSRAISNPELDEIQVEFNELSYPVSTNSEVIGNFIHQTTSRNQVQIVLSTYDSVPKVAAAMDDGDVFDVGIFDEAHNMAGQQGKKRAFALSDDNIMIEKRLFMTATPKLMDYIGDKKDAAPVFSMDDVSIFGNISYEYGFASAIRDDIICDYKIVPFFVDPQSIGADSVRNGYATFHGKRIPIGIAMAVVAIKKAMYTCGLKKGFTFHSRISDAQDFADCAKLLMGDDVKVAHINGSMPAKERNAILARMNTEDKMIITNARCLTEGINVPDIDFIAPIDPMSGKISIVQATGRALRKCGEKRFGYIIIPITGKDLGDKDDLRKAAQRFQPLVSVLGALKDEGEDMNALFIGRSKGEGFRGHIRRSAKRNIGKSLLVLKDESLTGISTADLEEAITTHCVRKMFPEWEATYTELCLFVERFGLWPASTDDSYIHLYKWSNLQRRMRKAGSLSIERIKKLDEIDFPWEGRDVQIINWIKKYNKFIGNYEFIPGEAPKNHLPKDLFEASLEADLVLERNLLLARYIEGKLPDSHVRMLRELANIHLGETEEEWVLLFSGLASIVAATGGITTGKNMSAKARRHFRWLDKQIELCNDGMLSVRRIRLLNTLGVGHFRTEKEKRASGSSAWYGKLENLSSFFATCKRTPPKKAESSEIRGLYKWFKNQIKAKKEGKLTFAQEQELEFFENHGSDIDDIELFNQIKPWIWEDLNRLSSIRPWTLQIEKMHDFGGAPLGIYDELMKMKKQHEKELRAEKRDR